jgi:DNA primase
VNDFDIAALLDLLAEGGLDSVGQTHKSYVFHCPRCNKKKKLYVRKWDGKFVCWSCPGFSGDPEFLLADLTGVSVETARQRIHGTDSISHEKYDALVWYDSEDPSETRNVLPVLTWPYHCLPLDHPHAVRGVAYLESRGVPRAVADEYGIRYSPQERRVYFPVEAGGALVGWQARLVIPNTHTDEDGVTHETPKILSSIDIPRDQVLMFGDRIVGKTAIVCEGPFDAIKAHLAGGACATMGKTVTRGQVQALRDRGVQRIYLALDPDAAIETMALVREFWDREVFLVRPPPGVHDLGDMTFEQVHDAVAGAERLHRWDLLLHWG